jgi:hypothetical protein
MIDFENYKFRCSSLGSIVSKSGTMTQGVKTFLDELFIELTYNVRKDISSKYMEKGTFEETAAIGLINKVLYPDTILIKNKERKSNDFITGECDFVKYKCVTDVKNAWDIFTFGKAELTHEYRKQLIGYMWLWELDKARLAYTLINTPEHILQKEEYYLFRDGGFKSYDDQNYIEQCEALRARHNYDKMNPYERIKAWEIQRSEDEIEEIKECVLRARKYLIEKEKERQERIEYIKSLVI